MNLYLWVPKEEDACIGAITHTIAVAAPSLESVRNILIAYAEPELRIDWQTSLDYWRATPDKHGFRTWIAEYEDNVSGYAKYRQGRAPWNLWFQSLEKEALTVISLAPDEQARVVTVTTHYG